MKGRRSMLRPLLLLAGVALLVLLVARLGPAEIAAQITRAGPGIVWLLVAYAAGVTVGSVPWYWLLPRDARPTVGATVASRFAASGANALLPLFGFGGEPTRLLWLPPRDRAAGVAAIIVDRLLYIAASALFLLAGVAAVFDTAPLPDAYVIGGAVGAALLLLGTCAGAWMVARHRVAGRIHRLVRRLRGKSLLDGANGFGDDIDEAIEKIFARPGRAVPGGLGVHFAGRVLLGAEVYVGFLVLGVSISPTEALIFASVPVVLSFVGSVVPSQIGLQEGSQALVAVALGVPPSAAVAVVLMQRVRQVTTVSLAWALIASARHRPARQS